MERINQWLSLLANVGVVFGLVFLAYELKQNRDASVLDAVQANREQRISLYTSIRDSEFLPPIEHKLRNGTILDDIEKIRWNAHLAAVWATAYSEWVQKDLELISDYSNVEMGVRSTLALPGSVEWWGMYADQIYPAAFIQFVDERMPK